MENMEMVNEVASNEAVEEVTEAVISNKSGLKTGLIVGGAMVAGAVLWERVLKPVGKKVRVKLLKRKAAKARKPKNADSDPMEVEEVQPIE